jgi:nicotinate-nucleotide pyrophosphorylase (carboxylating)
MDFRRHARAALAEDRARRDITGRAFVPAAARGRAFLVAREPGVLAGLPLAEAVFRGMDRRLRVRSLARDGARVRPGQRVLEARGALRSLLAAERSALNFLTHLSGVATQTRLFVDAAGRRGPAVLETRKTLPGLRDLQKYAVRFGGGTNHRRDLSDAYLIKENHLAFYRGAAGRAELIRRVARARRSGRIVEMEARDRAEVLWALDAGADIVLLDNMPRAGLPATVRWVRRWCAARGRKAPLLEVSGGVTLAVMPALARAGIDRVSVGRLTHSVPALDFNMDVTAL